MKILTIFLTSALERATIDTFILQSDCPRGEVVARHNMSYRHTMCQFCDVLSRFCVMVLSYTGLITPKIYKYLFTKLC